MEAVYSDSCGCLNKRGRWSVGRSFTLPPLYTQMLKEDYILAFCSTFPLEDVSETGSFSESQACLAWHLLTLLAAPHLHITSMGGEGGINWYPLPIFILLDRTARCSLERVWKGSRFTKRNGPHCKDGAAIWLTSHWLKTQIIFRIKAGLGKLPGTASLVSQVRVFRILVRSWIKPWFLLLMIRLL